MKYILIIIVFLSLLSCSGSGDNYTGYWKSGKYMDITIKKAGDKGYFIVMKDYTDDHNQFINNYFCTFEDDCFVSNSKTVNRPVICVEANVLIDENGAIYNQRK